MDSSNSPICLSQYFVDKQNVRSFSNIIKSNLLKEPRGKFLKVLLDEKVLVSELPKEFKETLLILKRNLSLKSKNDFKEYFHQDDSPFLQPINKEFIFTNCWKAISEIIPRTFFGCKRNNKLLKNLVQMVVYSMRRQHFVIEKTLIKWDFTEPPWSSLPNANELLHQIVLWIFKFIVPPIICLNFYVTTTKLDTNENKLYYFWKNQWQSFYDKQISNMLFTKVIKKYVPYSLGKKFRKNHCLASRVKLKTIQRDISKLHLILKANNNFRPIVRYKNNVLSTSEKYKIKDRLVFLKSLNGKAPMKIEHLYTTLYSKWISANRPKLYFIKTDLSNAFGSINREKLAKILSERFTNRLKTEKCIHKKNRIAQQYKDVVMELRKPILIRAGSTVYEWTEGLVQGYKYSPALSEIYYSYMDAVHFSNHMESNDKQVKLFTRVVDDYLYITDSIDDAMSFLDALSNYNNVNDAKTLVNFPHDRIPFSDQITFLGYCYNTQTMEVSRASNIYAGQMCYKISFTSGLSDLPKFLESRISQSGIPINSHIFNLQYNNEKLIWRHIFTTFCLSANKFCTILAVVCELTDMKSLLQVYKKRVTVKLSISIVETLIRHKPADFIFVYCVNHLRYLSWKALYLCAKLTPKCSGLVPLINVQLAKSNCIFSAWREHACRIDASGKSLRIAIKEVCRRPDLRQIFREFESLPTAFECYHHRRLN